MRLVYWSSRKANQKLPVTFTYCVSTYVTSFSVLTLHYVSFQNFPHEVNWRALYGVNFRPLQEIETIMGGGRIFDTWPFLRDYGISIVVTVDCVTTCMYVDHYCLPLHLLWFQLPLLKLILMEHLIVLVPVSYYKYTIHILILWYCIT